MIFLDKILKKKHFKIFFYLFLLILIQKNCKLISIEKKVRDKNKIF